jgi:hypothetical protein
MKYWVIYQSEDRIHRVVGANDEAHAKSLAAKLGSKQSPATITAKPHFTQADVKALWG